MFFLFSITDLGTFLSGAGATVADTVTAIKLNVPYAGVTPNYVQQPAQVSSGLLAGGTTTLLLIAAVFYFLWKR